MHNSALQGQVVPGVKAQQHKTHVTDTAVSHQALEVSLGKCQHRAVDHPRHPQTHGDRGKLHGNFWEQGDAKPQQAISACFEQYAGQQHTAGGGCLGVCIRQPGVEGEGGQFHCEGEEKSQHGHPGQAPVQVQAEQVEVTEAEHAARGDTLPGQCHDRQQHQQPRHLGEDEELHCRIAPVFMPPDSDQ